MRTIFSTFVASSFSLAACIATAKAATINECRSSPLDRIGIWHDDDIAPKAGDRDEASRHGAVQLHPDHSGDLDLLVSDVQLPRGSYAAKVLYMTGRGCTYTYASAQVVGASDIRLKGMGLSARWFRASPFFAVEISKIGFRVRIGAGS